MEYFKVRQSNTTGSAYNAPRAQDLELRDNYIGPDEPREKLRSEMVLNLNTENSELMEENATLKRQIVKHVGMLARLERSLSQSELELSGQRNRLKTLEEEVRIGRVKLQNEIARSEKFKLAYENLRSHPVIRAGRNLKATLTGQKLR